MKKKKTAARKTLKKAAPAPAGYQPLFGTALPWLSAAGLGAWSAFYLWRFQAAAFAGAPNTDGGVLFGEVVFCLGFLFAACGIFSRGSWRRVHPLAAAISGLAPYFFIKGAQGSAAEIFTLAALPWYVAGNVVFLAMALIPAPPGPDPEESRHEGFSLAALLLIGLGLAFAVVEIRQWALAALKVPSDKNSLGMFFVPRAGGATDISGGPFSAWMRLLAPAAYALLLVAGLWVFNAAKGIRERWILAALFAMALLGKLCIAFLSHSGLEILPIKISSINTNYYSLVKLVEEKGLYTWLKTYNDFQLAQGAHGDTHPPGPVLFYWLLTRVLGHSPWLVALSVAALASLSAPLIYRLGRDHYQSEAAGLGAAVLYLSSPISLILSSAGIDSIVALFLLLGLRSIQKSLLGGAWKDGLLAGAWFFLGSYFSFGLPLALMFGGLYTLHLCITQRRGWGEAAVRTLLCWLPLLAVMLGGHLLWWAVTGGQYHYWKSLGTAQFVHRSMNQYRTYELWSWANVVLYAGFAGLATLAGYFFRAFSALWRSDGRDGFLLLSVPFVLTLIFSCMGRGEVQREFLYGIVFLALPAGRLAGGEGLRLPTLALLAALNLAGAVFLEMHVLDFW